MMNTVLKFIFAALCAFLCACSESVSAQGEGFSESDLEGMIAVKTRGSVVTIGTDYIFANANERPPMRVTLNYDFSIGKAEVTCGEFNALMKKATGLKLDCAKDNVPATNLTYYDAVLFANERSKAEKRDTAYTYAKALFDNADHCINLEGFTYNPEAKAYRLPTESEWMFVAEKHADTLQAWTADNSDYELHKVCSIADSNAMFCDLIGNAMEWVNDWLGNFRDTAVTNYVGAPDGGSLGMRIVKGGSYRNLLESIKLYKRGDVYTVTSSTRAAYVGFRLAFGAIPDATWMSEDGRVVDSRVVPLVSSTTMRSLMGTYKVKLAFRNEVTHNLGFIDFSGRTPVEREILDTLDVYHPDISPDGSKVAFCTGLEGVTGKSELYVRDLDEEGSNLVKLDVESAAIPRWRVLENGDTVIVYVNDAGSNDDDSWLKSTSTWQVSFANGKFGKPEKLFEGAYHGGLSEDNTLAVTGARLLRARVAKSGKTLESGRDTVWYNRKQACNASLAKDSSKRTLFLDFGGSDYGVHEKLFVANQNGKVVQSIPSPKGYSFDHSEWTIGGENTAVATLVNSNDAHQKIALVNLSDSSITEIVEGDELWHPCVWVKENPSSNDESLVNTDSAGVYFIEGQDWTFESLGYKMTLLWRHKDEVEILAVGSSRVEATIEPSEIKTGYALNMGHMGNDLNACLFVAENYGLTQLKKLKFIVLALDIDLWLNSLEFSNMIFPLIPGYVYDAKHKFWKDEVPNGFIQAVENASNYSAFAKYAYEDSRGFLSNPTSEWGSVILERDSNWTEDFMANLDWNLYRLESFLNMIEDLDVKVIGVIFPQNPLYRETGSWGRYGPRRSVAEEVQDSLWKMEKRFSNFFIMDENKNGEHDYTDEEAVNADHLGFAGAKKLSHRLDSLMSKLLE